MSRLHLLGPLTELAVHAGRAILSIKERARGSATSKADNSPVTEADLAADAVLRAGLEAFGGHVITEETHVAGATVTTEQVWVVDPLDGTREFIAGRPDYCVQIGLIEAGAPVLGVVHQPETGISWRADVPSGTCERVLPTGAVHPIHVANRALHGAARVVLSGSHRSAEVEQLVTRMGATLLLRGSVGLKVGMILDDEADAYVTNSARLHVWDTGGPAALLLAAGGLVTRLNQQPLTFASAKHDGGADGGLCAWTPAARAVLLPKLVAHRDVLGAG